MVLRYTQCVVALLCDFRCEFVFFFGAAHENKVDERIEDYRKIISGLDLPRLVVNKQYKSDGKWRPFSL